MNDDSNVKDEKARVLIVDDFDSMTDMLKAVLNDAGYEADVCQDGFQAMRKLAVHHYDLLITDILMPEFDGLELSRHIRENLPGDKATMPIMAISGGGETLDAHVALGAAQIHVDAVLRKPFDMDDFLREVDALLAA